MPSARSALIALVIAAATVSPSAYAGGDDQGPRFYEATPGNLVVIYARLTEETREHLPLRLDDNTTLIDVTLGGGEWHHTLRVDAWPSEQPERQRVEGELRNTARSTACANPGNRELMAAGYSLRRSYVFGMDDTPVLDVLIRPDDCGLGDY